MRQFNIVRPEERLAPAIQQKIDNLNKPKGSLGRLEELAMQICLVQQTLSPELRHPCHLLLGGDHGIEREGVSVSPRDVTWQQMINFTRGGGGVNMFCRQHGFKLRIVDVGVDHDLSGVEGIIDRKIAWGTKNFLYEPAMSQQEMEQAIETGAQLVDDCHDEGCNIICIGEMGIANTSPSSIWMHLFGNIPLDECIGAGAGLNAAGISHKREVLRKAVERFLSTERVSPPSPRGGCITENGALDLGRFACKELRTERSSAQLNIPLGGLGGFPLITYHLSLSTSPSGAWGAYSLISYFGGFEMVTAIGAMLRAAELRMLIMVDGFIMSACALAASRLYPETLAYMVFGHCGDESGHRRMLELMDARPLLSLGLKLGEGTGALCSFPIIDSAVRMMNEMNNFDNAHITKYF